MSAPIWLGLFDLVAEGDGDDVLDGAAGAVAYAAAIADDEDAFLRKVQDAALEIGLRVTSSEEVAPAMARGVRRLSGQHRKLISQARRSDVVEWGTFHSYESDDE